MPIALLVLLLVVADTTEPATRVDFYDGAEFMGSDSAAPYVYEWDDPDPSGVHRWTARVFGAAGMRASLGTSVTLGDADAGVCAMPEVKR